MAPSHLSFICPHPSPLALTASPRFLSHSPRRRRPARVTATSLSTNAVRGAAQPGRTYLVGSGPGGVDHVTHRAARLVATADVIVADALADEAVLALRRPDAAVWRVGKRGGDARSVPQADICALLTALPQNPPRSVVRLKAGDPCLFGRATEELEALAEADLPVDVVPGVSSVSAAAAALGVSLTEKTLGKSVVTVSGHDPDLLDFDALAACDAVAILMAGRFFRVIMERLREAAGGANCMREVSVVHWALRPELERIVVSSIHDIVDHVYSEFPDGISPAVVLVTRSRPNTGARNSLEGDT